MFFVYGLDKYILNKQVNKLIEKINSNNEYEIFKYSLIEDKTSKINEEINTFSLFSSKKIVVIYDSWFVTESKVSLNKEYDQSIIEKILDSQNEDVDVIFVLESDKFSKKLKIAKKVEEKCKVIKLDSLSSDQIITIVSKKLSANEIGYDQDALTQFVEMIPNDMSVVSNELNKLIELKEYVTVELVKENMGKYYDFDIFDISNAILEGDINKFLVGWHQYKELNNDLFRFSALVASNLISIRNIKLLRESGNNQNQIADRLGINSYRVKKLLELNTGNVAEINEKIKKLYLLNYNISRGLIDQKIIPELELLRIVM